MLKEFAVDPRVIASSYDTCRYLLSLFGADKGRLISKFPKRWKTLAIEAADALPDGYKKERVIDYLSGLNSEWLTLISSGRFYGGGEWLNNAIEANKTQPFQAIICDRYDPDNGLINADDCDERTPLFAVSRNQAVNRTANGLAEPASLLLMNCRKLRLVDPYFKPQEQYWRDPLAAFLSLIPDISRVECEYHILETDKSPTTELLVHRLAQMKRVIPRGGRLRIIRWKERNGGERFHGRYLMIENAGLNYEGGLDVARESNQTTDVTLLDQDLHRVRWSALDVNSGAYDLVAPVLAVDWECNVIEEKL